MVDLSKTVIHQVLEKIPEKTGAVFSTALRDGLIGYGQKIEIIPKSGFLRQGQQEVIENIATGERGKAALEKGIVKLGASFKTAHGVVADGKLDRREALQIMAEIGGNIHREIKPGSETMNAVSGIVQKYGITDEKTIHRLAQFELGTSVNLISNFSLSPSDIIDLEGKIGPDSLLSVHKKEAEFSSHFPAVWRSMLADAENAIRSAPITHDFEEQVKSTAASMAEWVVDVNSRLSTNSGATVSPTKPKP